jgi:hypothetical protein
MLTQKEEQDNTQQKSESVVHRQSRRWSLARTEFPTPHLLQNVFLKEK